MKIHFLIIIIIIIIMITFLLTGCHSPQEETGVTNQPFNTTTDWEGN